jgi:tRNA(Arg) A34 adenosine deaminase TadA
MSTAPLTFGQAWQQLEPAARRSLEMAHEALVAGGLAVGSVLTNAAGHIVAEGRNHAYDPRGGRQVLQRTPIAHAEMNALAAVDTDFDLGACTLWSTQEPCSMCAAAAAFVGVGSIRYLALDPWAVAAGVESAPGEVTSVQAELDPEWAAVVASILFLLSVARPNGMDHPTVARSAELDPATVAIVAILLDPSGPVPPLDELLTPAWAAILQAAR